MTIPFLDLKAQYSTIKEEIHTKIEEVCENTAFSNGPYVRSFEKNFAKYCSVKSAVAATPMAVASLVSTGVTLRVTTSPLAKPGVPAPSRELPVSADRSVPALLLQAY